MLNWLISKSIRIQFVNSHLNAITYILPLRSLRLNSLPDDPEAAAKPVADAAENEANEPDNAFSPGVPALIEGWPDELLIKFMPKVDLLDDGIFCC